MFNIKIEGKILKEMIEKVQAAMMKDSHIVSLSWIVLEARNEKITACSTSMDSWLIVTDKTGTVLSDGKIAINKDDLKVITRMTGSVEITETNENIIVRNGKKVIRLIKHDVSLYPELAIETYEEKMTYPESDFLDMLTNLSVFCDGSSNNKIVQAININLAKHRFEALDGHRIGIKKFSTDDLICCEGNILLHMTAFKDLKKTLDKKSYDLISISDGNKYIAISGNKFTYYLRKIDGNYFNVNQFLETSYSCSFNVDTKMTLDHFKYYKDNVIDKCSKDPVILKIEEDKVITYGKNVRFETSDELEISTFCGTGFTIGFDPVFLVDAFRIADAGRVTIKGNNSKSPIIIEADNYSFLVLPVNLMSAADDMENYLSSIGVA